MSSQGQMIIEVEHVLVSEDASLNTVVHVIQAFDPDGDDVTFAFTGTPHDVINDTFSYY